MTVLSRLRLQLAVDGWHGDPLVWEATHGTLTLRSAEKTLEIQFVDPGFIPAEVTISSSDVDLN